MGIFPTLDDEQWLNIISTLSLISAAGFGLLGLLTEYKIDGRVTKWGKVAALGIVASAVMSIGSSVLATRIKANQAIQAKEQRALEANRFQEQIDRLANLERDMTIANDRNAAIIVSMRESNAAQRQLSEAQRILLGQAESTFNLTTRLDRESRASAQRVLKSLWDEANRIEPSGIELMVSVDCEMAEGQQAPPIFSEGAVAIILVRDGEQRQHSPDGDQDSTGPELDDLERLLFSYHPDFQRVTIEDGQTATFFRQFLSFRPEAVADPEVWRHAIVDIVVSAPVPGEFRGVRWSREWSSTGNEESDTPCKATLMLTVNGRLVAFGDGFLSVAGEDEREQSIELKVSEVPVEEDVFPSYRETQGI